MATMTGATHKRHTWYGVGGVKENPGVWSVKATHPELGGNGEALRFDEACACGARRTGYRYNLGERGWTRTFYDGQR